MGHFNRVQVQVRLRPFKVGDVVTVKSREMYFYLPEELPDRSQAVVVGRESGRIIVEAFGKQWDLPMQSVDNGAEYFSNDRWLEHDDRRVKKALAKERRARTLGTV